MRIVNNCDKYDIGSSGKVRHKGRKVWQFRKYKKDEKGNLEFKMQYFNYKVIWCD